MSLLTKSQKCGLVSLKKYLGLNRTEVLLQWKTTSKVISNIKVRKVATDLFLLYCDVHQSIHIVETNVVRDLVLSIGY